MRTRLVLVLAVATAVAAAGLQLAQADRRGAGGEVATAPPPSTTTAPAGTSTSSTSAPGTTTSTPATTAPTTAPVTTVPPTSRPPAVAPPATAPPPTAPPPTAPPPTTRPPNPRISTVTAAELGASWRSGCPVGPAELRRITVTYRGFDGADHTGALIVHRDWAEALLGVFDRIHRAGFPIQRIEPVSAYGGSDEASMAANNTSAFNCRPVTNGTSWSNHSYGTAIDLNPVQNPYVRRRSNGAWDIQPVGLGDPYAHDRSARRGVITAGDAVVSAFAAIGWSWGGNWTSLKDYQHFDLR